MTLLEIVENESKRLFERKRNYELDKTEAIALLLTRGTSKK